MGHFFLILNINRVEKTRGEKGAGSRRCDGMGDDLKRREEKKGQSSWFETWGLESTLEISIKEEIRE